MSTHSNAKSQMPCSFYAKGACRMGLSCKFYHAEREEYAVSPLVCKFFLQDACKNGRDCKFSHIIENKKNQKIGARKKNPVATPGVFGVRCKFFHEYGACATGANCPYLHETTIEGSDSNKSSENRIKNNDQAAVEKPRSSNGSEHRKTIDVLSDMDLNEQDAELSDFISKEEETYYYGAPGEYEVQKSSKSEKKAGSSTYGEIVRKNIDDIKFDKCTEIPAAPKKCLFFLQGSCRYGDACFYSHSVEDADVSDEDMIAIGKELQESKDLECGICYENILDKLERFGLLSGCNHAFCLTCVRDWRANENQPKEIVRQCPICRVETAFIIPCNRMITNPSRKQIIVDKFQENVAHIPCRHFDQGSGTCPFGTSCFYEHRYREGTLEDRKVRTVVNADGKQDVVPKIQLKQFVA